MQQQQQRHQPQWPTSCPCTTLLLLLLSQVLQECAGSSLAASGATLSADASFGSDILTLTKCEAKCWNTSSYSSSSISNRNKHSCVRSCLISLKEAEKPGVCRLAAIEEKKATSTKLPLMCPHLLLSSAKEECQNDAQCFGMDKCCKHLQCGRTSCQPAHGLDKITGLPPVPTQLAVRKTKRKKRNVLIEWHVPPETQSSVLYVLEQKIGRMEQYHSLEISKAQKWTLCTRTPKSFVVLRNSIKPGKWYQFRVAAVNSNGTRGFTSPISYILPKEPKPPKMPQNVHIGHVIQCGNQSLLCTKVSWETPKSDLPIEKFKIFWSKQLTGSQALDLVLMLQKTLPALTTNRFVIQDLQPNSLYFIQIQALAHYEGVLYRGEKSGHVLNTSHYDESNLSLDFPKMHNLVDGLHLEKLYWSKQKNKLKARISWRRKFDDSNFSITWWSGRCKQNRNDSKTHLKSTFVTKALHFDIYDLQFDCRYRVEVKETSRPMSTLFYDTSLTFSTPSCKEFHKRNRRRQRMMCFK